MQSVSLQCAETIELPEQKRVHISVSWGHIDVLIAHEIRPGNTGHLLNAAADAQCNMSNGPVENECGGLLAILPRLLNGLTFRVDRQPRNVSMLELDVKPGAIGQCGAGVIAMGRFRLEFPCSPLSIREISISTEGLNIPVEVDFKTKDGVCILESSSPNTSGSTESTCFLNNEEEHWIRVHGCCCDEERNEPLS